MTEYVTFIITEQALRLKFEDADKKAKFIAEMSAHGIDFTGKDSDDACDFSPYSVERPCGFFLSKDGRVALNFTSEEQKFFFKERTGLKDEQFMDMGAGHETQMHFNHLYLPCAPGATLVTVREAAPSPASFRI